VTKHLFSLVIPAYNESRRIDALFWKLLEFQSHWKRKYPAQSLQVVIVVEPSQDNTLELMIQKSEAHSWIRVIGNPVHYGKGFAVRTGVMQADGEYIGFSDADVSTPLETVFETLEKFRTEKDIDWIAGERSTNVARKSLLRSLGSKVYRSVRNFILKNDLTDTQCGFKVFRRDIAHELFRDLETVKFAYDIELFCRSKSHGFRFQFLPVKWLDQPNSTVKFFRDGIRMLIDTVVIAKKFHLGEFRPEKGRNYKPIITGTGNTRKEDAA